MTTDQIKTENNTDQVKPQAASPGLSRDDVMSLILQEREKIAKEAADRIKAAHDEAAALKAKFEAQEAEVTALKESLKGKIDMPRPAGEKKAPTVEDLQARLDALHQRLEGGQPVVDFEKIKAEATANALAEVRKEALTRHRDAALKASGLPEHLHPVVNGGTIEKVNEQIAALKAAEDAREKAIRETIAKEYESRLPNSGLAPMLPAANFRTPVNSGGNGATFMETLRGLKGLKQSDFEKNLKERISKLN